ncbi:hypothetical protein HNQ77_001241 [Silvibacterium bohemicum]|uniref:Uncharacterized protein n=1 Tax=Silvibacterium bohemicum TaxID=1577686 RepID=A0A841JRZ6_9BACT|nr:hypothetical protein [Silvibacterium bohemicum]
MRSRFAKKSLNKTDETCGGNAAKARSIMNNKEEKTSEHEKYNKSA